MSSFTPEIDSRKQSLSRRRKLTRIAPAVLMLAAFGVTACAPIAPHAATKAKAAKPAAKPAVKPAAKPVTSTKTTQTALRINAGSSKAYHDSHGQTWVADSHYLGGTAGTGALTSTSKISNTADQGLYQKERWGAAGYHIPVANGAYTVDLKFAEINPASGPRSFDVSLEGKTVLSHFSPQADAGAAFKADDKEFNVTVTGGVLDIGFTAITNAPTIEGIQIVSGTTPTAPAATPTASATPTPSATPSASARPTPTPSASSTPSATPTPSASSTPSATPTPTPTPTQTQTSSPTPPASTTHASGLPWMSGVLASGIGEESAWASFRGKPVDIAIAYNNRDSGWGDFDSPWNLNAYAGFTGSISESIPYAPSNVGASLQACANGDYNSHFTALGNSVNNSQFKNGKFILRLSWEFNGSYFYWTDSNNTLWINCFRQEAGAFKKASPKSLVDFTINGHGTDAAGISHSLDAYPGDAYVDIIGTDNYDHYSASPNQSVFDSLGNAPDGIYTIGNFARAHGKQMSVGEWGVATCEGGTGGGDNPFYIQAMYNTFMKYKDVMSYESYFNYSGDGCYSLNGPDQAPNSSNLYKSLF